jgi:hypothetical protein
MEEQKQDSNEKQIEDEKDQKAIRPASSLTLEILILIDIFYSIFFYIVLLFLFIFKRFVFPYPYNRIIPDVIISIIFCIISFVRFRIIKIFNKYINIIYSFYGK